ncbi:low molecular weight phosphatase family protein [Glutamicibacter protophormiae]|uniref:arsenate-mycothiol transferase ArsC n=1 Tax=Glutamicibacter protophormiae TaxID=37930 RepID=UPI002A835F2E|nr:low molecular weight phosphatase family protein [Glutamicibacter protophormiae]WPR64092.1 low molecular weight phosphatase family protein [Glutamicibacter protophormiae]WPR67586.1 low molecular weight phosphatase family protein [Glutamicibacter protophormiae]
MTTPSVLFICSRNAGKSQMAAALMDYVSDGKVTSYSAGTNPGVSINHEAVASLAECGADMAQGEPKPIDPSLAASVDRVVILGTDANPSLDPKVKAERWVTYEPSEDGITGAERMNMIRDEIADRVRSLFHELEK